MLVATIDDLKKMKTLSVQETPKKVLMVKPEYFDVEYAINPHMLDAQGNLKQVNKELALIQWKALRDAYRSVGLEVYELAGIEGLPDMVFCANTSFPYLSKDGKKCVIASQMHSDKRKEEVKHILEWYEAQNYSVHHLQQDLDFEANGDALIHNSWILGGHGFRTKLEVYNEISERSQLPVVPIKLISDKFYHLDTCLSVINEKTVALVKEGFAPESLELLEALYEDIIRIDLDEALNSFAANCHCPDGKNVFLHDNCPKFIKELQDRGFQVHPLDTSEYMKSGGSVFCMKMMVY